MVRPSRSRLAIRKWTSAWAAIWGRWVTHRTWCRRASAPQAAPDRVGAPAADPAVDLVEHERRRGVGRGQDLLDRERDPATARRPTRSGPAAGPARRGSGRSGRRPRRPRSRRTPARRRRSRPPLRPAPAVRRPSATSKPRPGSRAPPRASPTRRPARPAAPARVGQRRRRPGDLGEQRGVLALAAAALPVEAAQPLGLGRRASPWAMTAASSSPYRRSRRVDRAEALLERGRARAGSCSMPSASVADLGGDVVELGLERRPAARRAARSAGRAGPARAPRGAATAVGSRAPRALPGSASWTAAAPRAIASPCWAAPSRARISSASPGRSRAAGDLGGLVLEELDPAGQLARVDRQLGERRPVRPPALDGVGHRRARRRMPAERVEQVALPALVEQPLLVVLAVDLDERPDLVGEPRRGRRSRRRAGPSSGRRPPPRGRRSAARAAGRTAPRPGPTSAPWRTSPVSARAPRPSPSASISRLLPGAGLAGDAR